MRAHGRPNSFATPVIAVRMETLLAWVTERVAEFPRDQRFTIGDRLFNACLYVMENLVEASYRRDSLVHTLRWVSDTQHLHFAQESHEIGKMLGDWIRTNRSR